MSSLVDQLSKYATYHRDRRNIATHLVGVPMIVVAVCILLSRPSVNLGGAPVSIATVAALATTLYYFRLDTRYGLLMALFLAACLAFAQGLAAGGTAQWAGWGIGLFVVGWVIQFVGHYFEGRKPAFVDDIMGLLIGPLFVMAEAGFLMGLRRDVQAEVEARAGAVRG